jgi:hypothetical protein
MPDKPLLSRTQISLLLRGLQDSVTPVRIALLRDIVRLPFDAESTELLRPVLPYLHEPEVIWTTFVPSPAIRDSIFEIVESTEEEERSLAKETIAEAERRVRESGDESFRLTARFAQLVLNEYDPRSENLLVDAEDVARQVAELGKSYVPDVAGLYNVYRVWLRRAATFWFRWVEEQKHQFDPATQVPSWFPIYEGPLAVSRQIEWAVSRGDTADTLTALQPALQSGVSRDRFAAAQLIEWSQRTKPKLSYWQFGGGSGPGDSIPVSVQNMLVPERKSSSSEKSAYFEGSDILGPADSRHELFGQLKSINISLPPINPPTDLPTPPTASGNTSNERQISFWIVEREQDADRSVPLELGVTYSGRFRVGVPVAATLFGGADVIPDSAIPQAGLKTHWRVIPTDLQFAASDKDVSVSLLGEAEFDLLVPKIGNSPTISLALTPTSAEAGFLVLISVGGKLYRELTVSLRVADGSAEPSADGSASKTTRDYALARLGQADLRTTHEWTTPPGSLTLYVYAPGRATIFGSANGVPYPPGEQVYVGTEKSELNGTVDSLRRAAESLRTKATAYFNDIDPTDLLNRLDLFQPQYDWAQLGDYTDPAHNAAWIAVAGSKELQVLAFYGRKLYDTLFPADQNSRIWTDALPPGQLVHVVWRKDSGASWIPYLPWELLYCGDANPGVPIDPTKFWGLRYRLQYTSYNPPRVPSASLGSPQEACCTNLMFFGNSPKELAEVQWQKQIWTALSSKIKNRLVPSGMTDRKSEILKALTDPDSIQGSANVPAAVLYLFCHYGKDPNDTPILRFGDTSNPDDILTEPEFGTSAFGSRPLVFANACATAGTDVYSANAVTKAFFDRGCRAFIGTDCMVPAAMASRFAVIFFYFFLRLVDKQQLPMAAGEAIAQTRLFLWCHYRNIGGLLYSYLNQYDLYMASDAEIRTLQKKG